MRSTTRLKALGERGARVRLDPDTTPVRFAHILEAAGAKIVAGDDPCILPKAIKNATEIEGARAAHLRDGAAIVALPRLARREFPLGPGR